MANERLTQCPRARAFPWDVVESGCKILLQLILLPTSQESAHCWETHLCVNLQLSFVYVSQALAYILDKKKNYQV